MKNKYFTVILLMFLILTFSLTTFAAGINLDINQDVPSAYINDSEGQDYSLTIENRGTETAENTELQIDIPQGFSYKEGSLSAFLKNDIGDSGTKKTTNISIDGNTINIEFDPQLDLNANQILDINYKLSTDKTVTDGFKTITVKAYYTGDDQIDDKLVEVVPGELNASFTAISPTPFEAKRGEKITIEARIENIGEGNFYKTSLETNWGTGFVSPEIVSSESNITPALKDNSYQIEMDKIGSGEVKYFRYELTVKDYQNFSLNMDVSNPAGLSFSDDLIFNLLIEQPAVEVNPDDVVIDYANPGKMNIEIKNLDQANVGPAREFSLDTNINSNFNVSNLSSGWSYSDGEFIYTDNNGTIEVGEILNLSFDIQPQNCDYTSSGEFYIKANYKNDIDQLFQYPLTSADYSFTSVPNINLKETINSEATDGDNRRVFLEEEFTFEFRPTITNLNKWKSGQNIVFTDTFPDELIIKNIDISHGDFTKTDNKITWNLTLSDATSSNPVMTVETQFTSDADKSGRLLNNTATVSGTTISDCNLEDKITTNFYLQSRKEEVAFEKESKYIDNLPDEGSYDVSGKDDKDIIQYRLEYGFDSESGGTWTGSILKDDMNRSQDYVDGSAKYRVESGEWKSIPSPSNRIISTDPLKIDLGFLKDEEFSGDDSVAGKDVSFRYKLQLTNSSLSLGSKGKEFVSRTDLKLNNALGGAGPDEDHFYQGVFVPISRALMNVDISLNQEQVEIGEQLRATVDVNKVTPWNNNNTVVTVKTNGNYEYIANPSFTGFGEQIPEVDTTNPEEIIFTFSDTLGTGEGGQINFDLNKTDTENTKIDADLSFDDDLSEKLIRSDSDTAEFLFESSLSVIVQPDPIKITQDTMQWEMTVSNIGSGTAYGVKLENELKEVIDLNNIKVDGEEVTPDIKVNENYKNIKLDLGDLAVGESKDINISVATTGQGTAADFINVSNVTATTGWLDKDNDYNSYGDPVELDNTPLFIERPSRTFLKNSVDDPINVTDSGTVKLLVKNIGKTENYNLKLTQNLGQTGLEYKTGTARIVGGSSINDPVTSGNQISWTYDSEKSNSLSQLEEMSPGEEFEIEFEVESGEELNQYQNIQADADWQTPEETGGTSRSGYAESAEYKVPIKQPNMNVTVLGKNITAGDTSFEENVTASKNDEIEWKIEITNSGNGTARNVILENLLPENMSFIDITGPSLNSTNNDPWDIADFSPGDNESYIITAEFRGTCGPDKLNTASVRWGESGSSSLTTPGDNEDSATFITEATVTDLSQGISNFTTKNGRVTITIKNTGAPLYNLSLTDNITNRFLFDGFDGNLSYSSELTNPSSEPAISAKGDALNWEWAGPIPAGTHTISFDIRDNPTGDAAANGASITGNLTLDYKNSCGEKQQVSNRQDFDPGKAVLEVTQTPEVQVAQDGEEISWTIKVENTGDADATNVEIVNILGDGTQDNGFKVKATNYTKTPTSSNKNESIFGDSDNGNGIRINAGESYTVDLNAEVTDGKHISSVTAAEYNDYQAAEDKVTVTEDSTKSSVAVFNIDITMDKDTGITNDPTADTFGEIVDFTVDVSFDDTETYKEIQFINKLPSGMEYISGTINNPSENEEDITDKKLKIDISDKNGKTSEQITFSARLIEENDIKAGKEIKNMGKIGFKIDFGDGFTAVFPDSLSKLQDKDSLEISEPELNLIRNSNPAAVSNLVAGNEINHTLTVNNASTGSVSPAYELTLEEIIPVGEREFDPLDSLTINKYGVTNKDGVTLAESTDYNTEYNQSNGKLTIDFLNTEPAIIDKGESLEINYKTKVDSGIAAGVVLDHKAEITKYFGQSSETTGVKEYSGSVESVSYQTKDSDISLEVISPSDKKVTPGDVVEYQASFKVPAGTSVYDISLESKLPAGMEFKRGSSIAPDIGDPVPDITVNIDSGQTISWYLETDDYDINNTTGSDVTYNINFKAVVKDNDAVVRGNNLYNQFKYNFNELDNNSASRTDDISVSKVVEVIEPELKLNTAEVSNGPYEAGDTLTYNVTIEHAPVSNSDAYDVEITDLLPDDLNYDSYTFNPDDPGTVTKTGSELKWGSEKDIDLAKSESLSFNINLKLTDSVEPQQVLNSRLDYKWSSQDGEKPDERQYQGDQKEFSITVTGPKNLDIKRLGDPEFVIGEVIDYKLTLDINKGTTKKLKIKNILPDGLKLIDSKVSPDGSGDINFSVNKPISDATGELSWDFGEVINSSSDEKITINYSAKIINDNINNAGNNKNISAYVEYNNYAGDKQSTLNVTDSFIIKEPELVIEKKYESGNYEAGDIVDYQIKVWHNNSSTPNDVSDDVSAYDIEITDIIPQDMSYVSASDGGTFKNGEIIWDINEIDTSKDINDPIKLTYQLRINDVRGSIELKNQLESKWYSQSDDLNDRREYIESTSVILTTRPDLSVNDKETNINTPTITGTTNTEQEGSTVKIKVDGKEYTGIVDENGDWSIKVTDEIPDGDYTVDAEITDPDNGNTTKAEGSLVIDTVKPTINVDDKNTADTTPPLTGTSDETGGTVNVRVEDNEGNKIFEGSSTVNDDGSWEIDSETEGEWTQSKEEFNYGEDYKVKAEITDEAGNNSRSEGDLQIYSAEPQIDTEFTAGHETRKPGEESYFELNITNNGEIKVKDMEITIPIPDGFELNQDNIQFAKGTLTSDQFEINEGVLNILLSEIEDNPDLEVGESKLIKLPGQISESGNNVEAGSNISTQAKLTYQNITDKTYQKDSTQAVIEVLTVRDITIVEPEIAVGNQGAQAIYPHTVTNAGNSLERVILSLNNLDGYTADWYYDSNGNQELDPNIDQLISRGFSSGVEMNVLSPGESENIIVAVNIPSDAPESEKTFKVNAKSNIEDGINDNVKNTLNIVEISPTLAVDSDPNTIEMGPDNKEYQYEGQSYKLNIDYGNTGDLAIDNPTFKIKLSEYVQEPDLAQIAANNDNIDETDLSYDSEDNIIIFNADELESEQSESFNIELTLNEDVAQGTEIKTEVEFLQNQSGRVLLQEDYILTAANRGPNQIVLTADPEVIYGDGESTSTLTATITDILGEAVEDETEVTFRIDDPKITKDNLLPNSNYEDKTVISSSDGDVVTATVDTKNGKAKIDIKSPDISSDNPLKIPVKAKANNDDAGEVSTQIYITFSPGELIGEIINGNTGLPEAGIEVQLWLNGLKTKTTTTDKDGQYSFSIPEDSDNYEIRVIRDNEALTIETGNFAAEADGKITRAPRAIAGKIYYENGDELDEETEIEIYKPDGERYKKDTTFMTTNNGRFYFVLPKENKDSSNIASALINKFASLFKVRAENDSNEWTIKASKFGILRKVNEPDLGQKSFNNDLLITLNSGIVVDKADNNKKIEGAEVYLTDISGNKIGDSIIVSDTGEYTFKDVSPGEYYLTAEADGYYDYQEKIILQNKNNIAQKIEMEKINQNDISITKESNNSSALPDETVEYTIKITNNNDRKLEGLEVTDILPNKLEYIADSVNQHGEYDSDKNQLSWTVDLDKDATLELQYRAKIVDAEIADIIKNTVLAEYNGFMFDQVQNSLTVSPDLTITKTAAEEKISMGDFISYKLEISNDSQYDLNDITVTDKLPPGFKYVQDSAVKIREDGKEEKLSPTKADRSIEWLGIELESESSLEIRYTLVVGSGVANNKRYINKAYVRLGETVISNTADAEVLVIEDPLFTTSVLIGKVYLDQNEDGIQTEGEEEKGLEGIRIISTNGQIVETDKFGRFHFEIKAEDNIQSMQTLVLKLDTKSLPKGTELSSSNPVIVKIREGLMSEVNFKIEYTD